MLNSASTIFTMDLFKRHWKKDASQKTLIWTGRVSTAVFAVIGMVIAPRLGSSAFKGIFTYIQEFQGFISPGILAAFAFGLIFKRAPGSAGVAALVLNPILYGLLLVFCGNIPFFVEKGITLYSIAFLNRMAITFVAILVVMAVITYKNPLAQPKVLPVREQFDMKPTASVVWLGGLVIAVTLLLYAIFW
jgi:SSS family solute:Na+ symporter